jgi:hypothetical protein
VSVRRQRQTEHVRRRSDDDVRERTDPFPEPRLERGAADADRREPCVRSSEPVPAEVQPCVGQEVPDGRPGVDELAGQPGEELLQDETTAREQGVDVTALRDPAARGRVTSRREVVAVEDRDLVVLRQHARREQPSDTAAHHHRSGVARTAHRCLLHLASGD